MATSDLLRACALMALLVASETFTHSPGQLQHLSFRTRACSLHKSIYTQATTIRMGMFDWLTGGDKDGKAPAPSVPAPARAPPQPASGTTRVPKSYDEIHEQAIEAVKAGLQRGLRRMEVEFPPIPNVNKISDGSASSQNKVRRANVDFVAKVAQGLSKTCTAVWIVCGDRATQEEMSKAKLPSNVQISSLKDGMPPARSSDIILAHPPAEILQWSAVSKFGDKAPTVVLNGVFNNGYKTLEMVYYLKPMTFNSRTAGYLISRKYPEPWLVFKADGSLMNCDVKFIQTADGSRPDLQAISRLFS